MKKKFAFVLSILAMVFVLGACGTDPKDVDYNGQSYDELKETIIQIVPVVDSAYGTLLQYQESSGLSISEIIASSKKESAGSTSALPDYFYDGLEKWDSVINEIGEYEDFDEESFSVDKSGKTLTTSLTVQFEKRTATFQVVYSYYNMEITSIVINPDYTLGEKMQKAGLNTAISMSIVFCVLILICLIIYCFNIFPYIEKKKKARIASAVPEKDQVVTQIEQREQQLTDDTELVAVIAAAIAASTGQSTSDFVVRSINRR